MTMTVDAAIVSRKSAALDFNTDGINASGKIWPREVVHSEKGIRAAGVSKDRPFYVLASSASKGTAESAADLFKNCVEGFAEDGSNFADMIAEFFRAFAKVLVDSGFDSSDCDFSIFVGVNDKVYLAKMGTSKLYRIRDDFCEVVEPVKRGFPDGKSEYGVAVIDDVLVDDTFVLLTEKVAEALNEDLMEAIYKNAAGDIKKVVAQFASQAVRFGCKDAISAIVIKITEVGESASSFVPPIVPAFGTDDPYQRESEYDADAYAVPEPVEEEPAEDDGTVPVSKGKKIAFLAVTTILVVLLLGIIFFVVSKIAETHKAEPGTTAPAGTEAEATDETTTEPASTEESTSEEESSSEEASSEEASTEEPTTEEPTTERPVERTTEEPAPETTEEPAPETTEEPAPETTEEPAPETTEEPVPETTEEPAPETTEEPAPDEPGGDETPEE
ncbi:MAG: hypothetical protein IK104_00470 [Clostridia bacterium]|nr:hypothetical protein [Clostridia bacterium]